MRIPNADQKSQIQTSISVGNKRCSHTHTHRERERGRHTQVRVKTPPPPPKKKKRNKTRSHHISYIGTSGTRGTERGGWFQA